MWLRDGCDAAPQADPEDTDEVLANFKRWQRSYRNIGLGYPRQPGQRVPGPVMGSGTAQWSESPGWNALDGRPPRALKGSGALVRPLEWHRR